MKYLADDQSETISMSRGDFLGRFVRRLSDESNLVTIRAKKKEDCTVKRKKAAGKQSKAAEKPQHKAAA